MPLPQEGDGPAEVPVDADLDDQVFDDQAVPEPEDPPGFVFEQGQPLEGYAAFDPTLDHQTTKRVSLTDAEGNPLPEFDERYRDDFEGLAFIGSLSKTFTWLGHTFLIRTLPVNALIAVGKITSEFQDTLAAGLAYRTALVSMAVVSVDGKELPMPVGPDGDDIAWAWQRYNYAKARWFPFTIDAINAEYLELETKVAEVVMAMGKAFAPTGSTTG